MKLHYLCALMALLLAACGQNTRLTVVNQTSSTLTDLVVFGTGFRKSVPDLKPGTSRRLGFGFSGETGVSVSFNADGKHFALPEEGYLENGYDATLTIAPDFTAKLDVR